MTRPQGLSTVEHKQLRVRANAAIRVIKKDPRVNRYEMLAAVVWPSDPRLRGMAPALEPLSYQQAARWLTDGACSTRAELQAWLEQRTSV